MVVFACGQMLRENAAHRFRAPADAILLNPRPDRPRLFPGRLARPTTSAWNGPSMAATGLNSRMNAYRDIWMMRMLERDVRIVDTQIMASLQNGTAFFASTTLLAIGGALTLFHSSGDIISLVAALPFGVVPTPRLQWEVKTLGLCTLSWSTRSSSSPGRTGCSTMWRSCSAPRRPLRKKATPLRPQLQEYIRTAANTARGCRTPVQPRPARLLLCARLSRLVHQSVAIHARHAGRRHRDVAAPVRVGFRAGGEARLT